MRYSISNTAEFGDFRTGPEIITTESKAAMKKTLERIQSGEFTREFIEDSKAGAPQLKKWRQASDAHQLENVGEKLRKLMPWIEGNKIVSE